MHKNFGITKALGWISGYWNRALVSSISYQDLKCGLLKNTCIKSDLIFNLRYASFVFLLHGELQGLLPPYSGCCNWHKKIMLICSRQHPSINYARAGNCQVLNLSFAGDTLLEWLLSFSESICKHEVSHVYICNCANKNWLWVMLVMLNLPSN